MNHNLPHFSENNKNNFIDNNETDNALYSDVPIESEQTASPERLPHPIHLYRTMSGVELWKFINHQEIAKGEHYYNEEALARFRRNTTANPQEYQFSPDRAECYSYYPKGDTALAPEELPQLDFDEVLQTWYLGDKTNDKTDYNLSVEFSTDVRPNICYGYYNKLEHPYLKEYTLPSHLYNSDFLEIERIYDLYGEQVIFDRQDFQNPDELEAKLHEIAEVERATADKLHQKANEGYGILLEAMRKGVKIPSPHRNYDNDNSAPIV